MDRLALVGSTGRGALEFRPDNSVITRLDYADFEKLAFEAEQILDSDDYTGEGIEEFQDRGGSPVVHDPRSSFAIIIRSGW